MDTWWRRSSGGENIRGEAVATEEEVSARTRSILKGMEERMVEAVIVTEEECKEVLSCTWRATEPEPTTHSYIAPQLSAGIDRKPAMLKPFLTEHGTSTSQSVRDGLLLVHPLVLQLPATLRASTLTMMKYTPNSRCVRRTKLLSLKPLRGVSFFTALRALQTPHIAMPPPCRRGS